MYNKRKNELLYVNILIILLFIVMLILVYISSQKKMNTIHAEITTTTTELEHYMQKGVNTVEYLAVTAQELAKREDTLDISFAKQVHPIGNKGEFALDNPHLPNITGYDGLNTSEAALRDMQISLELIEHIKVASRMNENFAWIYYISKYKYLTMYPYIDSSEYVWRYENSLKNVWQDALPKNNPNKALFFTPVYVDGAGKGLMITIGKPVYKDDTFRGTLDIDFTVDTLSKFLDRHNTHDGTYVLVNSENQIVAASGLEGFDWAKVYTMQELVPIDLERVQFDSMLQASMESYNIKLNKLKIAPWKLYYYKDKMSIFIDTFMYAFFMLLILALLFSLRKLLLDLDVSTKQLNELAIRDSLTGLYNKRHFDTQIANLFAKAKEEGSSVGLMMLDIDKFKLINDKFGHIAGDNALKQVANILKKTLRKDDVVCRYGGDEFIIILPNIRLNSISVIAEKLRENVYNTTLYVDNKSHTLSISVGVSVLEGSENSTEEGIHRVDKALYSAKKEGRNRVNISHLKKEDNE